METIQFNKGKIVMKKEQLLQEHPISVQKAFKVDADNDNLPKEEYDGCFWCAGAVDEDEDFCSEECKRQWVKE